MKLYTDAELAQILDKKIFHKIGEVADEMGVECYLVGGYVRDIFLERPTNDIDVVVVGSGIEVAQALQKALGKNEKTGRWRAHLAVYRNFGTAQVKFYDTEVEFVGARRESYDRGSRKPVVEDGTLEDDQNRRDFTINAMAVCLNKARFGELVDPFEDLVVDALNHAVRDLLTDLHTHIVSGLLLVVASVSTVVQTLYEFVDIGGVDVHLQQILLQTLGLSHTDSVAQCVYVVLKICLCGRVSARSEDARNGNSQSGYD